MVVHKELRGARHEQEELEALHRLDEECVHLQRAGNYLKAFDCMERALVLRRHFFGAESPEVVHACKALAEMCNLLSMSFLQQDNYAVTIDLLKKAEILTQQHPAERATTLNNLACYYRRLGKLHTAMTCLKKALDIEQRRHDVRNAADTHLNLCAVLSQLGRHQQALDHAQSALLTLQEEFFRGKGEAKPRDADGESQENAAAQLDRVSVMCIAYHNIGVEQEFMKDYENSVLSYKKGVGMAEQYLGIDHPIATTIRNSYLAAKRTMSTKPKSRSVGQESPGKSPGRARVSPRSGLVSTPPLRLPSPQTKDKLRSGISGLPSPRSIVADALAKGRSLPPLEKAPTPRVGKGMSPEDPFFSPRFRFDARPSDPSPTGVAQPQKKPSTDRNSVSNEATQAEEPVHQDAVQEAVPAVDCATTSESMDIARLNEPVVEQHEEITAPVRQSDAVGAGQAEQFIAESITQSEERIPVAEESAIEHAPDVISNGLGTVTLPVSDDIAVPTLSAPETQEDENSHGRHPQSHEADSPMSGETHQVDSDGNAEDVLVSAVDVAATADETVSLVHDYADAEGHVDINDASHDSVQQSIEENHDVATPEVHEELPLNSDVDINDAIHSSIQQSLEEEHAIVAAVEVQNELPPISDHAESGWVNANLELEAFQTMADSGHEGPVDELNYHDELNHHHEPAQATESNVDEIDPPAMTLSESHDVGGWPGGDQNSVGEEQALVPSATEHEVAYEHSYEGSAFESTQGWQEHTESYEDAPDLTTTAHEHQEWAYEHTQEDAVAGETHIAMDDTIEHPYTGHHLAGMEIAAEENHADQSNADYEDGYHFGDEYDHSQLDQGVPHEVYAHYDGNSEPSHGDPQSMPDSEVVMVAANDASSEDPLT